MATFAHAMVWLVFAALLLAAPSGGEEQPVDAPPRTDYITSAQGAWLVSIAFAGAEKGPSRYQAFETYDGLTTPRAMAWQAEPDAQIELIYELPALTTFDRLAVPEILEVPGPSGTARLPAQATRHLPTLVHARAHRAHAGDAGHVGGILLQGRRTALAANASGSALGCR